MANSQNGASNAGAYQKKCDRKKDYFFKWAELFGAQHKSTDSFQKKRPTPNPDKPGQALNVQSSIIEYAVSRSSSGWIMSMSKGMSVSEESRVATGLFLPNVPRFHRV
jgi:hypothetical protein